MFRHIGPMPLWMIVFAIIMFFRDTRKKTRRHNTSVERRCSWEEEKEREMRRNIDAVRKVLAEHADCTAEVFNVVAIGYGKVQQFRKISPGDKLEIRRYSNMYKIFVGGRFIDNIYPDDKSMLPRIFDESIPFEAYLGGRNMANVYSDPNFDSCRIVVFYRIEGVAPTKVNLE